MIEFISLPGEIDQISNTYLRGTVSNGATPTETTLIGHRILRNHRAAPSIWGLEKALACLAGVKLKTNSGYLFELAA